MKFDNDRPRVTLRKAELEALVMCASDDAVQVHIAIVRIDPSARAVMATNGMALLLGTEVGTKRVDKGAVYTTETCALGPAPGEAISISRKHVQQWLRFAAKDGEIAISWAGKKVTAEIDGQSLTVEHANTSFPPWRAVIPKKPSATAKVPHTLGLSAALVGTVLDALRTVSEHERNTCVAWHFNGDPLDEHRGPECHPVVLAVTGHESQWRAVVMPMRYANEDKVNPWSDAFPEPKKKEAEIVEAATPKLPRRAKAKKRPAKKAKRGHR